MKGSERFKLELALPFKLRRGVHDEGATERPKRSMALCLQQCCGAVNVGNAEVAPTRQVGVLRRLWLGTGTLGLVLT